MKALKWFYNRIGQMLCFGLAAAALTEGSENSGNLGSYIAAVGFLFGGIALKAIFLWRKSREPELV